MDIYSIITERILSALEKGVVPWKKPWHTTLPANYITEKTYQGINLFLLGMTTYQSPYWLGWSQIQQLGGRVRKDEHSSIIAYFKILEKTESIKNENDDELISIESRPMLRYHKVWNWEQTEGIPEKKSGQKEINTIEECEKIISSMTDKPIIQTGSQAAYNPKTDIITIPDINTFISSETFYNTIFHELSHNAAQNIMPHRKGILSKTQQIRCGYTA